MTGPIGFQPPQTPLSTTSHAVRGLASSEGIECPRLASLPVGFVCVLAYALWKTLDHLSRQAGLETLIRKPDAEDSEATPQPRPMSPEVILRELAKIKIGDIQLETTDGRRLALRRVARPDPEQVRILAALNLQLPERLSPDHFCSEDLAP